jgi:hypothetical protein
MAILSFGTLLAIMFSIQIQYMLQGRECPFCLEPSSRLDKCLVMYWRWRIDILACSKSSSRGSESDQTLENTGLAGLEEMGRTSAVMVQI